ncbi:MAG: hypothetical protein QXI37_01715 [Thermoprotei archaeon]
MRKIPKAAALVAVAAYLIVVGVAAYQSPVLGFAIAVIVPCVYLASRFLAKGRISLPVRVNGARYTSAFYTDSTEEELRDAAKLAEATGLEMTTVIKGSTMFGREEGYRYLVLLSAERSKSKTGAEAAMNAVTAFLQSKGRLIKKANPAKADKVLAESGGWDLTDATPAVGVFESEEAFVNLSVQALNSLRNASLLTSNYERVKNVLNVVGGEQPVLKAGVNLGVPALSKLPTTVLIECAAKSFGLSQESVQVLEHAVQDSVDVSGGLSPAILRNHIELLASTMGIKGRNLEQLKTFADTLARKDVAAILDSDTTFSASTGLKRPLLIDFSGYTENTLKFLYMMVANWMTRVADLQLVLDCSGLGRDASFALMARPELAGKSWFLFPLADFAEDYAGFARKIVFTSPSEKMYRLAERWHIKSALNAQTQRASAYVFARPSTFYVIPVRDSLFKQSGDQVLNERVSKTAPPVRASNADAGYLSATMSREELSAVSAAMRYVQSYGTVELVTFVQALGLGPHSEDVCSKLIRLGYIKRFVKSGIPFVELTERGEEELAKLRAFLDAPRGSET